MALTKVSRYLIAGGKTSVLDFGAVGDGSTDDTSAIQAALTAGAGGIVLFPATGSGYVVNSTLTIPMNTSIEFEDGALIDASNASVFPVMRAVGTGYSASLGGGLNVAAAKGTQTITTTSASGLNAGDIIIIHDPADGSWNPARVYYRKGEFLRVNSVSGNDINIASALIDSYPDTAEVYRFDATTMSMRNVRIKGNTSLVTNEEAIEIRYGHRILVENMELFELPASGLYLNDVYNFTVNQVVVSKTTPDTGSTESNGIVVTGQNGSITNCNINSTRRGLSITGGGKAITRFVVASDCYTDGQEQWVDLAHGGIEFCGVENSHIANGVAISGQNNFVRGCSIYARDDGQTMILFTEMRSINHEISNNKFYVDSAVILIDCTNPLFGAMTSNMVEDGVLRIHNNEIIDNNATAKTYFSFINQGSTTQNAVEIRNNIVRGKSGQVNRLIGASVASGSNWIRFTIEDNELYDVGLGIASGWTNMHCSRNLVFNQNLLEAFSFNGKSGYAVMHDNYFGGYNAGNQLSGTSGFQLGLLSFKDNIIRAGVLASGTTVLAISFSDQVVLSNNQIGNISDAGATTPINIDAAGGAFDITIDGDTYYGGPPVVGTNALNPSNFQFRKKIDVSTPATAFNIWTLPSNVLFMPEIAQARADVDVTATTGNYFGIGVDASNRRRDYGVSAAAAASSKYTKNDFLQFMSSPSVASSHVAGGEDLELISLNGNTDAAGLGSNLGGSSQSITVQISGNLVGKLRQLA